MLYACSKMMLLKIISILGPSVHLFRYKKFETKNKDLYLNLVGNFIEQ